MWEKFITLSLLAQLGLRSITPGSGFNTPFINFSLFMLERHFQWIKTSNLVDIPPSLGDIPEKYSGFSTHSWHSLSFDVMRTKMYSQRPGGQCSLLSFFRLPLDLDNRAVDAQPVVRRQCALLRYYTPGISQTVEASFHMVPLKVFALPIYYVFLRMGP